MKPYTRRRISRRAGRVRYRIRQTARAVGRAIAWAARISIPVAGFSSICAAAFLTNLTLGFLVTGVVLLVVDWWIERQK